MKKALVEGPWSVLTVSSHAELLNCHLLTCERRYDFFYLPRDVKFRANLGYAFINFITPEDC